MAKDFLAMSRPSPLDAEHHGVKGMKWGIRKADAPSSRPSIAGSTSKLPHSINPDGSVSLPKGFPIQRLVRSNGQSMPMKDLTFASITEYDNARYVKIIGGKGFLGGGRDQILSIVATKPIKAPPAIEATKIVSDLITKDPKFQESVKAASFTGAISKGDIARIKADPTGKTARAWYETINMSMTFDEKFAPGISYAQKKVRETMVSKGYNALRDENDFNSKVAKSPLIIFDPQHNLKVTRVTTIDDYIRKQNKTKLKDLKSNGKDWLNSNVYTQPSKSGGK